ncbi:SDR family oxidoreductase [Mesorhizobium sp. 1M-11]|uniref:SDR family oxidoreductase n=1 Tax=Mesorhizobium sp. 1M-11 TaxID=1529006 RepID=UPI0006C73809|nr:SDR family oxidoreductase [Mesorhizobium sp. 1M-11]
MSTQFQGKTAIVTGSSRGIGRAIAERLADGGATVVINYLKNESRAREVVNGIEAKGGKANAVRADMSKLAEIRRMFNEAEAAFGKLDIVVANAATAIIKPLIDSSEEDYDRVFDTNTKGVFFILQEAAKRLRDGGRIVVISTGGTKMFFSQTSLYLGSKGAVEQFVRVLSRELGPRNITVNAVSPGFTDTELLPERDRAVAAGMSAFDRIGSPKEVAEVAAFLASDAARWVTGQNVGAGGGVF